MINFDCAKKIINCVNNIYSLFFIKHSIPFGHFSKVFLYSFQVLMTLSRLFDARFFDTCIIAKTLIVEKPDGARSGEYGGWSIMVKSGRSKKAITFK